MQTTIHNANVRQLQLAANSTGNHRLISVDEVDIDQLDRVSEFSRSSILIN